MINVRNLSTSQLKKEVGKSERKAQRLIETRQKDFKQLGLSGFGPKILKGKKVGSERQDLLNRYYSAEKTVRLLQNKQQVIQQA